MGKKLKYFPIFFIVVLTAHCSFCFSEDNSSASEGNAFKWTDSSGRVFYGTKPPENSKSTEKLNTPTLSRYSSDKVLERMGSSKLEKSEDSKTFTEKIAEKKKSLYRTLSGGKPNIEALVPMEVQVTTNDKNQIITCSAMVENKSDSTVFDFSIFFEFSDETLIPAIGPESIDANEKGLYIIPEEILPILSKTPSDDTAQEKPKVIIKAS